MLLAFLAKFSIKFSLVPNISHAIRVVSRYMANPSEEHLQAVKWILQYLRGTTNVGLVYGMVSTNSSIVVRFVDNPADMLTKSIFCTCSSTPWTL